MGMANRTFYRDIDLGVVFNRSSPDIVFSHVVGSPFTAWRVVETNDENFQLNLMVDQRAGKESKPFLVDPFGYQNLPTSADDGVFENPVAQPGVKVKVQFLTEGRFDSGRLRPRSSAESVVVGGYSFNNNKYEVLEAGGELLPADDNRASSHVYNQTAEAFFVGEQAKIMAADYADTCVKLKPGSDVPFVHDVPGALWARKDITTGSVFPVVLNKGKT